MVLDARDVNSSINKEIFGKMKKFQKRHILVINKCDLISKEELKKIRLPNSMKISAKNHFRTTALIKRINQVAKGREVTVGVVGLPNTGKSTLINALKGRKSAPTSPVSGYTRGVQKLRISKKIMMLDTPGVFPYKKKGGVEMTVIGAIDAEKFGDPEAAAVDLIEALDGKVEKFFGVEKGEDTFETIEAIAKKKNIIMKGGLPDSKRMAKDIIRMWQTGKIR
ncbi:MAG: 50S ribosome-binding GTPase [Candidatus Woesearchaeota archaeon]|nr:50S ribosome-binding GTPase [Candidatus Woesearchaeota archaeon]